MPMIAKIDAIQKCNEQHCKQSQQLVKMVRAIRKEQMLEAQRFVLAIGESISSGKPKSHQDMLIKQNQKVTQTLKKQLLVNAEFNKYNKCRMDKCKSESIAFLDAMGQMLTKGTELGMKGRTKPNTQMLELLSKIKKMKKSGRVDPEELMGYIVSSFGHHSQDHFPTKKIKIGSSLKKVSGIKQKQIGVFDTTVLCELSNPGKACPARKSRMVFIERLYL